MSSYLGVTLTVPHCTKWYMQCPLKQKKRTKGIQILEEVLHFNFKAKDGF